VLVWSHVFWSKNIRPIGVLLTQIVDLLLSLILSHS
jgi:hypothetical protein